MEPRLKSDCEKNNMTQTMSRGSTYLFCWRSRKIKGERRSPAWIPQKGLRSKKDNDERSPLPRQLLLRCPIARHLCELLSGKQQRTDELGCTGLNYCIKVWQCFCTVSLSWINENSHLRRWNREHPPSQSPRGCQLPAYRFVPSAGGQKQRENRGGRDFTNQH